MRKLPEQVAGTPVPNLHNGCRANHIASEREIRNALRDKNAEIIECHIINITFVVSYERLTIVRSAILGGDVRDIEGGWTYANDIALRLDVQELRHLSRQMSAAESAGR